MSLSCRFVVITLINSKKKGADAQKFPHLSAFSAVFRNYFSNRMRASTAVTYRDVVAVWEQTASLRFFKTIG
jgi:hypothetical protein